MATRQDYPDWLLAIAEKWRGRLIPEWRVMFEPEGPESNRDGEASSNTNTPYRHVRIWVNLDHVSLDGLDEDQRRRQLEESVVHEMLHPLIDPIVGAYQPAYDAVTFPVQEAVDRAVHVATEQTIEQLARNLVALDRLETPDLIRVRVGRRPT